MFGQNNGGFQFNQNQYGYPQQQLNENQQYSQNFVQQPENSFYPQNQTQNFQNFQQQDPNFYGNQQNFIQQQPSNDMYVQNFQQQSFDQGNNMFTQNQNQMFQQPTQDQSVTDNNTPTYTDYENLPNFGDDINVSQVLDQMKISFEDKANWKSTFQAIDFLRILNKYYSKDINDIMNMFWGYIQACLESQKTSIIKNILLFLKEVFSFTAKEVRLRDEVISAIIPCLLKHSTSEKKLLKTEIESIIEMFVTHCCFDSSVVTLCNCCFDKNPTVCEAAFFTLGKMVANIGENLPALNTDSLSALMLTLAKTLDSAKKGNVKKWASMVCQNICNLFGGENYLQLIEGTVAPQSLDLAQLLVKAVEDKKDPKRESGIHDFIQEKKKQVRMSYAFGNGDGGNQTYSDQYQNQNPFGGFGNQQQKMNTSQNILGQNMMNGGQMQQMQGGYGNQYPLNFNNQTF